MDTGTGRCGFPGGQNSPLRLQVVFYAARNGNSTQSNSRFLFHFAQNDEWESVTGIRKLKKSLKVAGRSASYYDYPSTCHWFFESDRPEIFHRKAAALAWERTVEFLQESKSPPGKGERTSRELEIDQAIYLVDDKTRTYRYLRPNPNWRSLPPDNNETNKKAIDAYTRVLRAGRRKIYKRAEHP